jgi:hypothetical protein
MKAVRGNVSNPTSLVAPILGLNTRDGLGDMDPRFAIQLDNFFPQNGSVDVRNGHSAFATGMSSDVNSLIPWNGPAGDELFAGNGTNIFDVTASGAVGAAVVAGQTSDKYQYQNITTTGGAYVFVVNGEDDALAYDGTTWTNPVLTGITSDDIVNVFLHKNRLWLAINDSIDAYYLGTSAIAGAATKFPLGAVFRLGGYLQTMISLSTDSGSGLDDFMVFISSNGEMAVYEGTDPAAAATWALVGVYRIGKPIGRRCAFSYGGDGVIVTEDGVQSISKMIDVGRIGAEAVALTAVINPTFNMDARNYSSNFGWQGVLYPRGKWLLINVPQSEGATQYQYVMNTTTSAWCKFLDMNANCWCVSGDNIFFGGNDGTVYQADIGYQDDEDDINSYMGMAYNYFAIRGRNKHFKMIRPLIQTNGQISYNVGMNVDYTNVTINYPSGTSGMFSGWVWGDNWSQLWGGLSSVSRTWRGLNKIGFAGSIQLSTVVNNSSLSVVSFDVVYEAGGVL